MGPDVIVSRHPQAGWRLRRLILQSHKEVCKVCAYNNVRYTYTEVHGSNTLKSRS